VQSPTQLAEPNRTPSPGGEGIQVIASPLPDIYKNTWVYPAAMQHVKKGHRKQYEHAQYIFQTIAAPRRVHASKTQENCIILIGDKTEKKRGDPLRVVLKLTDSKSIMTTAHFTKKKKNQGPLIWQRDPAGE
jgi:hypothetical protein